jgi:hypothetical protein
MSSASSRHTTANNVLFFLSLWIGFSLFNYTYQFLALGWLKVLFGAKAWEWSEHWLFLSLPLALFHDGFVIGPHLSFLQVCGIIAANAYVQAALLFPLVRFVQSRIRANRTIQLGLARPVTTTDTAELIEDEAQDDAAGAPDRTR